MDNNKRLLLLVLIFALQLLHACKHSPDLLFTEMSSSETGIDFSNEVQEDTALNILTYEYTYNGAGVAIGDVNNDGLQDIYFSGNMVANKLYLNKGNFKFEDITEVANVAGRDRWKTGVAMADVNGDGLLDIYVCYSGPGSDADRSNELYINHGVQNGAPVFTENAAEYGLDAPGTFTTQVAFFDMDKDGDLDMFMVNHGDMFYNPFFNTSKFRNTRHPKFGNRLYRNDGTRFTEISDQAGIFGGGLNFSLSVSVSDLNNDGWPDLYVSNDYNEQDFLYLNNHNGTFKDVCKQSTGHISEFSMGTETADYNNDLMPDIVSLDMLPENNKRQKLLKGPDGYDRYQLMVDSGFHHQNMRNMLQLNIGNTADSIPLFSEVGQLAGMAATDWSWSPLLADFDNDGWKDLFITNGYLRDFTNLDFLKFTYNEAKMAAMAKGEKLNTWQLVQDMHSTKVSNYIYANNHNLTFTNKTKEWGFDKNTVSIGASYADLDNDGDLDLVVNNTNAPALVYKNNSEIKPGNHYMNLRLVGSGKNQLAIGSKVTVITDSTKQLQELYMSRGFQSSVSNVLHFGTGGCKKINTIAVEWPDGRQTALHNINADTLLVLNIANSNVAPQNNNPEANAAVLFKDVSSASGIDYIHQETNYVDFKTQALLPHEVSKQGPFITKADVDGNGLEDIFIGGNSLSPDCLYLQYANGSFKKSSSQPWTSDSNLKDAGVLFFDADGDKDDDLIIAKSCTEAPPDVVSMPSLYLNKGKGNFSKANWYAGSFSVNASCIVAADYDKDGDNDLFIGGRSLPGRYPEIPVSFLLKNETKNGQAKFVEAIEQTDMTLKKPGMVTTAVWCDVNADTWPDLVLAGEFMPVSVFINNKGKLENKTEGSGLAQSAGLWNKIIAADLDNDGDMDLVAGNIGLNSYFKASVTEPLSICYGDFDKNGSIDPILCYYNGGKNYPVASLDELAEQIPFIKKKFLKYEQYSDATITDLLSPEQQKDQKVIKANMLASVYLENNGKGTFSIHLLPVEAQFSCISTILVNDFDNDGKKDMLLAGNYYPWRVQLGKIDASYGVYCSGDGKGNFKTSLYIKNGLLIKGDVRDGILLNTGKGADMAVFTKNKGPIQIIQASNSIKN